MSSFSNDIRVEFLNSVRSISKEDWDSVSDPKNPFLEYDFLSSLEESGCIGTSTAWEISFCTFWKNGVFGGAIPFFKKYDSYGEYIFDFQWAQFYAQSGLRYYPKGLVAVPFTPANGKRILHTSRISLEEVASILIPELLRFSEEVGLSGIHFLFLESEEAEVLRKYGFVTRLSHQYHWKNRNYSDFNEFLADFKSKKRMQIKREREIVRGYGLNIRVVEGNEIQKTDMDAIWNFYSDTHSRKWGSAYLNRRFFDLAWERLRDRIVLVLADRNGTPIAGTLNFRKGDVLYGRYWGCVEYLPHLHFECCFYRLIEYAIEHKLRLFEAGAQGEHKFLRGFPAVSTFSSHRIFHPGARNAIERFLNEERLHMREMIEDTNEQSPLRELRIDPPSEDTTRSEEKERNL
ncbi:N-acetyltransferase [Leptospira gomenensis]|uniref:N-acetyltransferase n=1 Tax=Leptospira gomenensis TaxID=2484974 RepID=A0A5F1YBU7_9LEPT|nr:GNAT family N-acetyltransferase [Leptospira gomenensis]TGK35137.1 N-acetyltransferase [Leptospira gomenensis]TGK35843.1 N-acetyltransferase [Leptospira gomenensis]TGK44032.1 N-acetyltransferase [Leptospira gomenensis]TGK61228.1 N-acetyltransferase [Leptospira gomenensis]